MIKNKTLLKYSLFYSFGQYRVEKNISAYLIMLFCEAGIWGIITYFLSSQIKAGFLPTSAAFIIPVSFKCFFAIIEKYGELSIGFNLWKFFNIKTIDILKLRLLSKILNISEYFFVFTIIYFSFYVFGTNLEIALLILSIYYFLYEMLSFISYKYEKFENPIRQIFTILILVFASQTVPAIGIHLNIDSKLVHYSKAFIFAAIGLLSIYVIVTLINKNHKHKSLIINKAHKHYNCSHIPGVIPMLLKKDILYLIRDKKSILIFPVIYLIFFYFTGGVDFIYRILPIYPPLEFAMLYGFNYYGHDNEAFVSIVLSPAPREMIVREKSILFLILNILYILMFYPVGLLIGAISMQSTLYYFSFAFLALSLILIMCPKFSIKYYHKANGKSKYTLRFIIISICLFSVFSILNEILYNNIEINQLIVLGTSMILLLFVVYKTCIDVYWISSKFNNNERELLNKYLQ